MAQDFVRHTFTKGLNKDDDQRTIDPNSWINAENIEFMSTGEHSITTISPMKGSEVKFTIPASVAQNQKDMLYYIDNGVTGTLLQYELWDLNFDVIRTQGTDVFYSFAAMKARLESDLAAAGFFTPSITKVGAWATDPSINEGYFTIDLNYLFTHNHMEMIWRLNNIDYREIVLREAEDVASFLPYYSIQLNEFLFVFSKSNDDAMWELGSWNEQDGYTRLFRTWRWELPTNHAVDIKGEVVSDKYYAIYVTDDYNKPKVFYIPKFFAAYEDSPLKYTTSGAERITGGSLIYNDADSQTNLQLFNNVGLVTYKSQSQSGGGLVSGGYRYSVRFGINGTENTTEWSVLNPNVIPVFKASTSSPSAWQEIQGDVGGTPTGKSNILTIKNAKPNIFDYIELAALHYSGGDVPSAYIVGRYVITANEFDVTHTGLETGTIELDPTQLPQVDDVILTAKTNEIKKNRYNIANCTIDSDETYGATFASIASAATIGQSSEDVGNTGGLSVGSEQQLTNATVATTQTIYTGSSQNLVFGNILNQYPASSFDGTVYNVPAGISRIGGNIIVGVYYANGGTRGSYVNIKLQIWKDSGAGYVLAVGGESSNNKLGFNAVFSTTFNFNIDVASGDKIKFMYYSDNKDGDWNISPQVLGLNNLGVIDIIGSSSINFSATINQSTFSNTKVGEFQLPENCANRVGYMGNETYPFFMKFHLKSGFISKPYYINNYTFLLDSNLPFTDGTYSSSMAVSSICAIISNINTTSLQGVVDGISIWRGVCNPTVLGTGIYLTADKFDGDKYIAGNQAGVPTSVGAYNVLVPNNDDKRKFGFFISSDTRHNKNTYTASTIKRLGSPKTLLSSPQNGINSQIGQGCYMEYLGATSGGTPVHDYTILDSQYVEFGQNGRTMNDNGSLYYKPALDYTGNVNSSAECIGIVTSAPFNTNNTSIDNGIYMAQLIRTVTQQYDIKSIKIVPTGCFIPITKDTPPTTSSGNVFGGDTYTQKNFVKLRYWSNDGNGNIRTSFVSYYGQNRVNSQLFYTDKTKDPSSFDIGACGGVRPYLFAYNGISEVVEEQFNYDAGYSAANIINQDTAYNSEITYPSNFISRIYYSEQKPLNSIVDYYRDIKPQNYRDIDSKNGGIMALRDVNNHMIAFQPKAVSVMPYQADVVVSSANEVLIGSGGVYNQREMIVSTYGADTQTAVIVGNNNSGNSNVYWYSHTFKKFMRYGADGIKSLSDSNKMRSWFLAANADNIEYNVHGIFDIEHQGVIVNFQNEGKCVVFNERMDAFSTFITTNPSRFYHYNDKVFASDGVQESIWDMFATTNYMNWFNVPNIFLLEFASNKDGFGDKRYLTAELILGKENYTNPTLTLDAGGDGYLYDVEPLSKRYSILWGGVRNSRADRRKQPVGEYSVTKVTTNAYIEILGAVVKFRPIYRLPYL